MRAVDASARQGWCKRSSGVLGERLERQWHMLDRPASDTSLPSSRSSSAPRPAPRNLFSVDLEDWFHLLELDGAPPPERWDAQPSRIEHNTLRLLELLAAHRVAATFFVLGWVAERFPALVRHIADQGHEIASHGHRHDLIWTQDPVRFRDDLRRASDSIATACGQRPIGYRAPGFSVVARTAWALEILAEEGFVYDSSVFPAARAHGGMPGARPEPHRLACGLHEFPVSTVGLWGKRVGYLGGGYLRALPGQLVTTLASTQARAGRDLVLYVHPRDIDPEQPRLRMSWRRRLRTYVGLGRTFDKLGSLLAAFEWGRFRDHPALASHPAAPAREEVAWPC
jgi:polysaccharide deacetylase family protein (PEP-CTERM system associated)